jgi:hypothetical protein
VPSARSKIAVACLFIITLSGCTIIVCSDAS